MKTRIQKWGNSLALRIPKSFAAETHLEQGIEVMDVRMGGHGPRPGVEDAPHREPITC